MGHGSKPDYWDRADLLEDLKNAHLILYGVRPQPGLYDDLEIRAIQAELDELSNLILRQKTKKAIDPK